MTNQKIRVRMNPLTRELKILNAAIEIALEKGCKNITRKSVAIKAQCAEGLVNHYFKNIENLKTQVINSAIEKELLPILASSLDIKTAGLPEKLKRKVIRYLNS